MNAMEKVAWYELLVSLAAIVVVTALLPWLGHRAYAGFALLALLAGSGWFLKRRGQSKVVVDERDRAIDQQSIRIGVSASWMTLFTALAIIGTWASLYNEGMVPSIFLAWLIFIQFAICYGVKGLVGVVLYRRQGRAA